MKIHCSHKVSFYTPLAVEPRVLQRLGKFLHGTAGVGWNNFYGSMGFRV